MLKPEQAREELNRARIVDEKEMVKWADGRLRSLKHFSKEVNQSARALMAPRHPTRLTPQIAVDHLAIPRNSGEELAGHLDEMDRESRLEVFEAMFPKIGRHVERAWQARHRAPYQIGWQRRAFRLPNHPDLTRQSRGRWLRDLVLATRGIEQDIEWYAAWATHMGGFNARPVGSVLAAAIEAGGQDGDAVFETMRACANGEHEIGGMGAVIPIVFLEADRPDAWQFIERMLLAAQRQEGLRQSILEAIDFAHPGAFRRTVRLIIDENLGRFSATVRAVDVWLGYQWDSAGGGAVNRLLEPLHAYLEEPSVRDDAMQGEDAEHVFLALWAMAFEDTMPAMERAESLLADQRPAHRFAAAHFLSVTGLTIANIRTLQLLEDDHPHLILEGLRAVDRLPRELVRERADLFPRVENALKRLPAKKTKLEPLIWPWTDWTIDRRDLAATLVRALGDRPAADLLPHLGAMSADARLHVTHGMGRGEGPKSKGERDLVIALVIDSSSNVRSNALDALEKMTLEEDEARTLEGHLTRKPSDLRKGVIAALMRQPDAHALASAERLIATDSELQRLAGLEILRLMIEADRSAAECRGRIHAHRAQGDSLTEVERQAIEPIARGQGQGATIENGLGLFDPNDLSQAEPLKDRGVRFHSKAAETIVRSLRELVLQHSDTLVTVERHGKEVELPFGTQYLHPPNRDWSVPLERDLARLPLREVWEEWLRARTPAMRDRDGLELVRAKMMVQSLGRREMATSVVKKLVGDPIFGDRDWSVRDKVAWVLRWLLAIEDPPGRIEFHLDAAESAFATLQPNELVIRVQTYGGEEHLARPEIDLFALAPLQGMLASREEWGWKREHTERLWRFAKWWDTPVRPGGGIRGKLAGLAMKAARIEVPRHRPDWLLALRAHEEGIATRADVIDALIGVADEETFYARQFRSHLGEAMIQQRRAGNEEKSPSLESIITECVKRILEIELQRGETPTAATDAALSIPRLEGASTLLRIVQAMGKDSYHRGWTWDASSRAQTLSRLIRRCFPLESDTPDAFAKEAKRLKLKEKLLIETAVYAPQWARHIEAALGWEGFAQGVWWVHAHTKDKRWDVDDRVREAWAAEANEQTPLTGPELLDGAVDVQWFHRVYETLGPDLWKKLDAAAKYSSGGGGHSRSRLYADAMRGMLEREDCIKRIAAKRNKDCVQALGLIPLPEGAKRDAEILERYEVLQEFLRTSKKFGSQRRASEKRSVEIGMDNLARTAGYPDPLRLQWAMEQRAVADLAEGPVTAEADGVAVTLSVDEGGEPHLSIVKGEKPLKKIPAKLKQHESIQALNTRKTELRRQASRMRQSLEFAMIRGDEFRPEELRGFRKHPILWPILENLVFTQDGRFGYPDEEGAGLLNHDGEASPIAPGALLRVAHPHDLLASGKWHEWQRECFLSERTQAFKQVFRELYPLTDAEIKDGNISRRYAGQQVNPRQALALFGTRGWVHHPEEGVQRTFHDARISAHMAVLDGFLTPAEVEGITLEGVVFWRTDESRVADLTEVPPRLFSEVMRDLDLVVSVAHRGGVDPEASASTIEMRAALLRETLQVLKVDNARIESSHVFVEGTLAKYSVHLGSGVVHLVPGGMLCIVPVHAQHRGRLFLPFADDDPRTAEVLTKVLMLARDKEIKDPTILGQIRGGG